jgi:hypothetical protein
LVDVADRANRRRSDAWELGHSTERANTRYSADTLPQSERMWDDAQAA